MSDEPIPFYIPELGEAEIAEVVETLRSGWLTTGPKTRQFEQEFAAHVGARHAIALNSATAALHLALVAAGIGPGDDVIVPTMTFAATAEVVIHLGARPVLVDALPGSLNLDPSRVEAAVSSRTRAIMPMHYGGQPCDMDAILAIARRHNLVVIEDAAHALPAVYRGRTVGAIGDMTCFSFYANKTITTGEGGMLTTDDDQFAERARVMSLHGLSRDAWKRFSASGNWYYEIIRPGYKYNLTDIAAAIGIHQLRKASALREQRARCAQWYAEALAPIEEITPPEASSDVEHAWHLYAIRVQHARLSIDRGRVIEMLKESGVTTSVHWMPLHMHPYYRQTYGYEPDDFPVSRAAFEQLISLPIFPRMTRDQVQRVADALRGIVSAHRMI